MSASATRVDAALQPSVTESTVHGAAAIDVSVVIPCLNEQPTIASVVRDLQTALKETGDAYEIIVADNGSTDGSRDVARAAGARIVDASATSGVGAATAAGVHASRGRWVILIDADGEHDPADAPRLLAALAKRPDALILGSRHLGRYSPGAGSWLNRTFGTPLLTALLNRYFDLRITDCNTGFRALARRTFIDLQLTTSGFEFCSEMIAKAALKTVPIVEIPIVQRPGPAGRQSHLRRFRDGWRHLKHILFHAPDRVLLRPGLFITGLGVLFFAPQLNGRFEWGPVVMDIHLMILGALLMFIGTEMVGAAAVCAGLGQSTSSGALISRRWAEYFVLDRVLPWASLLFALGLAADVAVVISSASNGWQGITVPRLALAGTTGMGLAVQIIVLSFLHSVIQHHPSLGRFDEEASPRPGR